MAGDLKTPHNVPSMSGLPIDVTEVHEAVIKDRELLGLRIMALFKNEYASKKVPCSNMTGSQLISDLVQRAKVEQQISKSRSFEDLSSEEQNKILARTITLEWTLTHTESDKKERLTRTGRNPAQCL